MSGEAKHDYHLVNPSPWPALGAFSAFTLFAGFLLYLHPDIFGLNYQQGALSLVPGGVLVLVTMFLWWRDVIDESVAGFHKPIVQLGLRYGMVLFILSEVMFFAAFFWAFFDASIFPADTQARIENLGGAWPPPQIETISAWSLPLVNTVVLLLSGVTVTWAHHAILEDKREDALWGLGISVGLGVFFVILQAYEYGHAAFSIQDTIYGSTFFMATGFHGAHVIIGTIFLGVCWLRLVTGGFTSTQHFGFEAAAWYWHFVDVVWLFLFCGVYWWGGVH